MNILRSIATVLAFTVLTVFSTPSVADQTNTVRITLASTPESMPSLGADGKFSDPDRPGFRITLIRTAGMRCRAEIAFAAVPWTRALEMVKSGTINGAFAASFSQERAEFSEFPMADGKPDPTKAVREVSYSLYAVEGAAIVWDGARFELSSRRVVVERGSIGVALVKRFDMQPVEVPGYPNMVKMIAERREAAMLGIDANVQAALRREPQLQQSIRKLEPILERQYSYVIFSKEFAAKNRELVNCVWREVSAIRGTSEYRDLVRSYNDGDLIE